MPQRIKRAILEGNVAIVTGGTRGIGLAIAKELTENGAKVVICSRTQSDLDNALKQLSAVKRQAMGMSCDVSKISDCKKLINFAIDHYSKINILVNNAGVYGPIGPLETLDLREWKKALDINLLSMVILSHQIIPLMAKQGGGKIINLCGAGIGGKNTLPRFSLYFTSKMAVAGLTEVLAAEVTDKNIQINCISPGAVNTYFNEYLINQGPEKAGDFFYKNALKLKKEGGTSPKLAAKLVAFLSSHQADHITGRLLSAKWDLIPDLKKMIVSNNFFKLRRIDQTLFYEK